MSTLTADWRATVKARIRREPAFRGALLCEGVNALLAGDVATSRSVLCDINATLGIEALGAATGIAPKSLMRMFGPDGNPQAQNLFAVLSQLQKHAQVRVEVKTVPTRPARAGNTSNYHRLRRSTGWRLPLPCRRRTVGWRAGLC